VTRQADLSFVLVSLGKLIGLLGSGILDPNRYKFLLFNLCYARSIHMAKCRTGPPLIKASQSPLACFHDTEKARYKDATVLLEEADQAIEKALCLLKDAAKLDKHVAKEIALVEKVQLQMGVRRLCRDYCPVTPDGSIRRYLDQFVSDQNSDRVNQLLKSLGRSAKLPPEQMQELREWVRTANLVELRMVLEDWEKHVQLVFLQE